MFLIMAKTKLTIKHFPSKPGGHFLEARRAFFCPRAEGVKNLGLAYILYMYTGIYFASDVKLRRSMTAAAVVFSMGLLT